MKDNSSWSCSWSSWKICLLSVLFLTETITAVKLPPKLVVPALFAFGDSIVDTGMNNNVKTVVKCDFHPYGIDFQGGVATGRFCDGRVPADLLAEELGIKSIVPAYLDPNLKSKDLLTGVSFASGGSGYDPITPKLVAVISLEEQLTYFEEYIEKVKNIVGEERKDFIVANSLFLLVAGSDDIANTYYTIRARPEYDIDSYTTLMSDSASEFVTKLYGYGVRRVAVFGAPPIGCVPSQRTLGGGIMRDCAETYNEAAKLFNSKLSPKLDSLRKTLPGIKPIYINIYDPLFDIIQNPANYGNIWPYGRSFNMRMPTGRFGNGRVFSDIVAEGLGIKKILPAYRKLFVSPSDLRTGVCFASGGAGVDPVTSKLLRVLTPRDQVNDFKGYIRKLKATAGPSKAKEIVANAVILVSQGNNDIGISYFGTPSATFRGLTPNRYTTKLAGWNKQFMKELYDQGARKFAVMGVIPLGCLPMSRIFLGGFVIWCNFFANRVAEDYNGKLRSGTKSWGRESGFSGAKFVYVDMFNTLMDVIKNHRRYGFSNEKNGCCCMITAIVPCPNPDKYVFYDFVHPSEKAYKTISKKLVQDIKNGLA